MYFTVATRSGYKKQSLTSVEEHNRAAANCRREVGNITREQERTIYIPLMLMASHPLARITACSTTRSSSVVAQQETHDRAANQLYARGWL
ncbi:hypothetical protein J6590_020477 [Homalodisca vitripennis]|nr:hypothetical protein J6590_020477 [Homalodisca vitripennis]